MTTENLLFMIGGDYSTVTPPVRSMVVMMVPISDKGYFLLTIC